MAARKKPASKAAASAHPLEGKRAPAFKLETADATTVALGDLIGKQSLVLYFYPKDMTPGCTTEACGFRDNVGAIRKLRAEVVGISGDSAESHRRFAAKHGLNFTLLADPGNKVSKLYGVFKKKSLYGREFMGIERTTFIIDSGGVVRKVFPKVKVSGHTDEVIKALVELA